MDDPYAELGVSPDASPSEIRAAYRVLAWDLHPDRADGDERSAERLLRVNAAHEQLIRPRRRRELMHLALDQNLASVSFALRPAVTAAAVVGTVSLLGGFLLGQQRGVDVDAARASGARAGTAAGKAEAARRSRAAGISAGRRDAYVAAQAGSPVAIPNLEP